MLRFHCLGFQQLTSEEDAKSLLEQIAQIARHESHQTLVCEPFQGCKVSIRLNPYGDPERVDTILESECQKFIFESFDSENGWVRLFSSFEEKPLSPIRATSISEIFSLQLGNPIYGELWGFADSMTELEEPQQLFVSEFLEDNTILSRGILMQKWTEKNQMSGKQVNLAEVYAPGAKSVIAFAEPINASVGTCIEYSPTYYFNPVN